MPASINYHRDPDLRTWVVQPIDADGVPIDCPDYRDTKREAAKHAGVLAQAFGVPVTVRNLK